MHFKLKPEKCRRLVKQYVFSNHSNRMNTTSGVARGGSCPRAPPGGGRQNPAKEFYKIYIRKNFENSERIK